MERSEGRGITKWAPDKIEEARNMALLGYSEADMARVWGISTPTIDLWKKLYPEFQKALKDGKSPANAKVVASLYKKAIGYFEYEEVVKIYKGKAVKMRVKKYYPPDTEAIKYFLSCKEREKWSQRTEVTNTNIHITRINLGELTTDDLKSIQQMQMKYLTPPESNVN